MTSRGQTFAGAGVEEACHFALERLDLCRHSFRVAHRVGPHHITMKFAYTILYVPDVSRALAFYESAFGLKPRFLHESGTYGELETGSTTLAFAAEALAQSNIPGGFQPASLSRPPAASEIGLATADVPAAYERALAAGAPGVAAPKTKPWGQVVAYVRDLDGHLVELCTPMG